MIKREERQPTEALASTEAIELETTYRFQGSEFQDFIAVTDAGAEMLQQEPEMIDFVNRSIALADIAVRDSVASGNILRGLEAFEAPLLPDNPDGPTLKYLAYGSRSIVFMIETDSDQYVLRLPKLKGITGLRSIEEGQKAEFTKNRLPYFFDLDNINYLEEKFGSDMDEAKLVLPEIYLTSAKWSLSKYEGERQLNDEDYKRIEPLLDKMKKDVEEAEVFRHDPLWTNSHLDYKLSKETNFRVRDDGTIAWIDFLTNY